MAKLKLDLHPIAGQGERIDAELERVIAEAVAKRIPLVEIIPGKGSGQLKKRVLRFLQRKDIKQQYYRLLLRRPFRVVRSGRGHWAPIRRSILKRGGERFNQTLFDTSCRALRDHSPHLGEDGVVIGLVGDFLDEFGVDDAVILVDSDESAGADPGERSVFQQHPISLAEIARAHGR